MLPLLIKNTLASLTPGDKVKSMWLAISQQYWLRLQHFWPQNISMGLWGLRRAIMGRSTIWLSG